MGLGLSRDRGGLTLASSLCSRAVSYGPGASLRSGVALLMALPASLTKSLGFLVRLTSAGDSLAMSALPQRALH